MSSQNTPDTQNDSAKDDKAHTEHWHRRLLEGKGALFAVLTTVAISIGGIAEIIPLVAADPDVEARNLIEPYTALEVAGRDIYVREGCYTCHSQMVRPFRSETLRYGPWSRSAEYVWDRPFQLGSRRAGPDLHRVGKKYPDSWHYEHMRDPRSTSVGSVMPPFPWLHTSTIDPADIQASMTAQQIAGTPYDDEEIANAPQALKEQGTAIANRIKADLELAEDDPSIQWNHEIVALTGYLQSLGRNAPKEVAAGEGDGAAEVTE